jgi:hypothetical protein
MDFFFDFDLDMKPEVLHSTLARLSSPFRLQTVGIRILLNYLTGLTILLGHHLTLQDIKDNIITSTDIF